MVAIFILGVARPFQLPHYKGAVMAKQVYVPKHMLQKEKCLECGKLWTKAMLVDYRYYSCIRCYNKRKNKTIDHTRK